MMETDCRPRVAALITARGGSKGLPGKNILPLAGKPLIAYTIEAAHSSSLVQSVFLSSDDPAIITVAESYGCVAPFVRDSSLATDEASSLDVVLDALDRLPPHDVWVLLQPTSPLRTAADIDAVVGPVVEGKAESAVAVRRADDHPYLCYSRSDDGRLLPFCAPSSTGSLRRQDLPDAFVVNGAVYAFRPGWLIEKRKFVGEGSAFHIMDRERSIDVDTIEDFVEAAAFFREMGHSTRLDPSH
jgi:CMP-N,N'-diacetyllegionaminic acid synthase